MAHSFKRSLILFISGIHNFTTPMFFFLGAYRDEPDVLKMSGFFQPTRAARFKRKFTTVNDIFRLLNRVSITGLRERILSDILLNTGSSLVSSVRQQPVSRKMSVTGSNRYTVALIEYIFLPNFHSTRRRHKRISVEFPVTFFFLTLMFQLAEIRIACAIFLLDPFV